MELEPISDFSQRNCDSHTDGGGADRTELVKNVNTIRMPDFSTTLPSSSMRLVVVSMGMSLIMIDSSPSPLLESPEMNGQVEKIRTW